MGMKAPQLCGSPEKYFYIMRERSQKQRRMPWIVIPIYIKFQSRKTGFQEDQARVTLYLRKCKAHWGFNDGLVSCLSTVSKELISL